MTTHLGANRYGKLGIRLATVRRDGDRHHFTDLEIAVLLEGDFAAAHIDGDNTAVLPTDTMRGTCYALAREHGAEDPVAFGRLLTTRLLAASPAVERAGVELVANPWERLVVDGARHDHTFRPAAGGQHVTTVTLQRDGEAVVTAGVRGFRIRVMATTVDATWGYGPGEVDHGALAVAVPATFGAAFAGHDASESVQHTLHVMGTAVLDAHPGVAWIRFRMPNEHHVLADLSPYGLDNPGEVFVVGDRPYGLIEGTVVRDGATPPAAW
jgi:urate oxidase